MVGRVHIGSSQHFQLKRALLVYGESDYNGYPYRHPFLTIHDVELRGDKAELKPGQLVTPVMIQEIMGGLGYKLPVEILPEHVLVRAADCVVWWAPAQERTMFFDLRGGDKALKALNGKRFPHPAMVFKVTGHTLWVRALVKNERPIASTPVYMAPYWNCYANGTVCLGTMRIPQEKDPTAVYGWEESFYQSAFSHAAGNTRACRYPGGFLAMWSSLKGKKCFPIDYLNPVKQTLKDFVENNDGNYSNQLPGE